MGWLIYFLANACHWKHDNIGAVSVAYVILKYESRTLTLLFAPDTLKLYEAYVPNPQFAAIFLDTQSCCTPSLQLC